MGLFGDIDALLQVPKRLLHIESQLETLLAGQEEIMAQVKVNQEDLDAIDQQLDESVAALTEKIEALNLPEGDLSPIRQDLDSLRGLHTPATEEVPEEPPA